MENNRYYIKTSVRELVEFVMRSGDIDNRTAGKASKTAMAEGSRMHRKIQSMMGPEYRAEVPLRIELDYEKYSIRLEGRADGIITEEDGITIDEIKTMYADVRRFKEPKTEHMAQAMCYAYIYSVENDLDSIAVQATYCNLDTEEIRRFRRVFTRKEIEEWFEELINQYLKWSEFIVNERELKLNSIKGLQFPFEYRKGQRSIVVSVYKNLRDGKNLFIQAPTGVGKTMSTIFPAVKYVGDGTAEKIFYLTAKTVTRAVAEEAYRVLREKGLHFNTVTLTAKEKICPWDETVCNPDKCSRAKGHFDRINDAIYDVITHETDINREVVERYGEKHNVCPFEFNLDISNFMDGIICDYNYVFDPQARLKRYFADGIGGNYIFLVDEAHNMIDRGREMYSAELVKEDFLNCRKIVREMSKSVTGALDKCNKEMLELKRECIGSNERFSYTLMDNADGLVKKLMGYIWAVEKFLDSNKNKDFEGREQILELYFKVRTFVDTYELVDENYEIYTDFKDNDDFYIKLFCVNPSKNIKECMNLGLGTVFFSATLLPVNYYKELLCGDVNEDAIYIDSPFDVRKRLLAIGDRVSTKFTRRNQKEYEKIMDMVSKIISTNKGNYLVFFPSYKLLQDVYEIALNSDIDKEFDIICQTNSMTEEEREGFLDAFVEERERTLAGFCVLGGVFSEGIDLKNERLIGSIVVGTGLPMVCSEKEILKNYYDRNERNGFDYAYKYPGMNKVQQAAGRVIRTDEDYGVIILLDERFLWRDYQMLFPREWKDYKIIDDKNIEDVVGSFWDKEHLR